MKKFFFLCTSVLLGFYAQGQISQINDSSMYGGEIQSYAMNASCVLVATNGGIYRTTDHGQHWSNATQNFDSYSVECDNIVCTGTDFYAIPHNSSHTYIYKSTDNGTSWTPLNITGWWSQSIGNINNTLYAVGGTGDNGYLYSSTDGISWSQKVMVWSNSFQGGNMRLFSFGQNKLYLLLHDSLYYTTDGNSMDTVLFNGLGITNISDDYDDIYGDAYGNLFFNYNNAIYKYNFTSKQWANISSGQIPSGYQILSFSVTQHAIFINAMNMSIGMKLFKSTDQGMTFSELTTNLAIPVVENIIEVNTNTFIANNFDERIIYTSNGGSTWICPNANQFIATYSGNLTKSGNALMFSREPQGIIRSANQGNNWISANSGIPNLGGIAYFVNEITQAKDTLFAFCYPNPFTEQVDLYKSINNGASWISSPIPSPYTAGTAYSFAGKCDSTLFISYYDTLQSNFTFIASSNLGHTWTKPNSQNTSERIYLKGASNFIFAFYAPDYDWNDFMNVYASTNNGASFTNINTGNLFNSNFVIKRTLKNEWDKGEAMMDINAVSGIAICVVNDRMQGNLNKLYKYAILPNIWTEITTSGLPADYQANCIKNIGTNSWLLATNTGLYLSTDDGTTWTITYPSSNWQNGMLVNSIKIVGNIIFLGTIANGVWKAENVIGIKEHDFSATIQVYPNPTANVVNVIMPDVTAKSLDVSLINMEGKVVLHKIINKASFSLDLTAIPDGEYILMIVSNGNTYKSKIVRK